MKMVIEKTEVDKVKCKQSMTPELYVTDKVYDLVKKGAPFRDAYQQISQDYENE